MTTAITVENLGKRYRIGHALERATSASQAIKNALCSPFRYLKYRLSAMSEEDTLWAIRNITFEVSEGEVLGIIGANGAGKSTLLKVLSRITDPTEGRAVIRGRVNALLEVGVGFHPELTGRENVFLSAALHGLTTREIRAKLDEIVDFSGVEKFLDTPVKRYSSGMRVRLGFAVAANLDPEILIVDEVLAVGDAAFQKKCLGRMEEVTQEGRTVLFVSHNMPSVMNLCTRCIMLKNGLVYRAGATEEVIADYVKEMGTPAAGPEVDLTGRERRGTGTAQLQAVKINNASGERSSLIPMGESLTLSLNIVAQKDVRAVKIGVLIYDSFRRLVAHISSPRAGAGPFSFQAHKMHQVNITIRDMNLLPGAYDLKTALIDVDKDVVLDIIEAACRFEVIPSDVFGTGKVIEQNAMVYFRSEWEQVI